MIRIRRRRREVGQRRQAGQRLRKGIYLVPSLFTVANIFFGFRSIVDCTQGNTERAAAMIIFAIVADVLDGRIARLTGATSSFGAAYDSIADVISFGVAPALLVFQWGMWQLPEIGWALAFLFLVAGSIRLARFSSTAHTSNFVGLPIPAGAGTIALVVLISPSPVAVPAFVPVVICFVLALSLLMVSSLSYPSFKDLDLRKRWPATMIFGIAVLYSVVTVRMVTPYLLGILAGVYVVWPVAALISRLGRGPKPTTLEATTDAELCSQENEDDSSETDVG